MSLMRFFVFSLSLFQAPEPRMERRGASPDSARRYLLILYHTIQVYGYIIQNCRQVTHDSRSLLVHSVYSEQLHIAHKGYQSHKAACYYPSKI